MKISNRIISNLRKASSSLEQFGRGVMCLLFITLGCSYVSAQNEAIDAAVSVVFETAGTVCGSHKDAANWILTDLLKLYNDAGVLPENKIFDGSKLGTIIKMVMDGKVNRKSGKKILTAVFEEDADPQEYADKNGLAIVADASAIEPSIKKVLDSNEKAVAEYLAGNTKNIQFLIGQSMRELRGKADPKTVKDILEKLLNELK